MTAPHLQWFWLSFADPTKPSGFQHLGSAVVPGINALDAISAAHLAKICPGGQVVVVEIQDDIIIHVPVSYRTRLLSKADAPDL